MHSPSPQTQPSLEPSVRVVQKYKCTKADARIRRTVKEQRGKRCECCSGSFLIQQLQVHHILETRIYPEHAREPFNMIVLCACCHSKITQAETFAAAAIMHFYSCLPAEIRQRHLSFLESAPHVPSEIVVAFRSGNATYWEDRLVRDLTR